MSDTIKHTITGKLIQVGGDGAYTCLDLQLMLDGNIVDCSVPCDKEIARLFASKLYQRVKMTVEVVEEPVNAQ